jgi:hypothetical protein
MRKKKRSIPEKSTEVLSLAEVPQSDAAQTREQLVAALSHEAESLIRSDAVFKQLQFIKKAIPIFYTFLSRERRRKSPSKQLQWFISEAFRSDSPVDVELLADFLGLLQLLRKQMEGAEFPPDTGEKLLRRFKNLTAIRKEPRYWREYRAFRDGKSVSEILREFHPGYDQLHSWQRAKYFRKVYNAIQRLVGKYGGPPLSAPPPHF